MLMKQLTTYNPYNTIYHITCNIKRIACLKHVLHILISCLFPTVTLYISGRQRSAGCISSNNIDKVKQHPELLALLSNISSDTTILSIQLPSGECN